MALSADSSFLIGSSYFGPGNVAYLVKLNSMDGAVMASYSASGNLYM